MSKKPHEQDYAKRIKRQRNALLFEVLLTLCIALVAVIVSLSNLSVQASQSAEEIKTEYDNLITSYIRQFDVAYTHLSEKIAEDPSFEEMDAWLKGMENVWAGAMGGAGIYDGVSLTYKGGFARSWSYGDYSDYDPATRRWYRIAEAANGKTATTAPYVTFMDSQATDDGSWLVMSIVRKYNDEIYVDYDIKLIEIESLLQKRYYPYKGTELLLFDKDGYILSCSDGKKFGHNLFQPDSVVSASLYAAWEKEQVSRWNLILVYVDGEPMLLHLEPYDNGNTLCMLIPFFEVFRRNFLVIFLMILFFICFEFYLYHRNKCSIMEFRGRDERLMAITNAAFAQRLFVDMDTMVFYGNQMAEELCPTDSYEALYDIFLDRIKDEKEKLSFAEFLSPSALRKASGTMYRLETQKFAMDWRQEDGTYKLSIIETGRMASVIDGCETVGILCRDISEDASILKEALAQAESAGRAKGDFMSRMSHEIRTPLNAIIGYLDIAKDEISDKDRMLHCLEQSSVAAKHLLSIINDVLDISSIESGHMKIDDSAFNVPQLVHSLTTIFYAQAKKKNVRFEVRISDLTDEWVIGDSLRVNQILLNLLSNAVKFTPENGEVQLDINQVGERDDKVYMQFQVRDTGIGMSREYLNRMFTPFEQENASTARDYGGTGLGLSICNNLVRLMSGTLGVESEQGKGTVFTVNLAFGKTEQKTLEHLSTESFSKLRALVVDDEESACEYIKKLLERCGVKCDTLTSGKKAVRRIQNRMASEYPYDFCIIDWNMDEMNGIETARQIRFFCGKEMPIIIATSYDYSSIVDEARKVGVNRIISKPLFQSTLFDMLVNTYGKYEPVKAREGKAVDFHGLNILLVEDNEMNMEIAVDILSKAGLNVTSAVNGKEALEAFTASGEGTYDAILMDVQMPVMDGCEATRAIRKSGHPQAKSIPIIAMTANAFTSDVTAVLAAGMNDHIAKPINYEHLFDTLSRFIGEGEKKE